MDKARLLAQLLGMANFIAIYGYDPRYKQVPKKTKPKQVKK